MEKLTQAQMNVLRAKLNEFRENFVQNREISATRERAMIIISQIFGENSAEYKRFINIGAYSWSAGGYTDSDIQAFISFIDGVLDTFDIFSA